MTEYVWCMDSDVAECPRKHPCNPTNDIVIRPELSVNRLLVFGIELVGVEFPRTQRLIEPCWSRLYFFSGLPLARPSSLRILLGERVTLVASLPARLNRVVGLTVEHEQAVDEQPRSETTASVCHDCRSESGHSACSGSSCSSCSVSQGSWQGCSQGSWPRSKPCLAGCDSPRSSPEDHDGVDVVFETRWPHHLPTSGVEVIGLANVVRGPFEPLSATRFRARVPRSTLPIRLSEAVQLYSPPEPSPAHIARRLTQDFNAAFRAWAQTEQWHEWQRRSSAQCPTSGRSSSGSRSSSHSSRSSCTPDEWCGSSVDCVPPSDVVCLSFDVCRSRFVLALLTERLPCARLAVDVGSLDLGFSVGEHLLSCEREVVATYAPAGTTYISLTSGNYVIEEMLEEINLRFNAGFLLPGALLSVGDASGVKTVEIPPGSYTPCSLSLEVSRLLAAQGAEVELVFLRDEAVYVFRSRDVFSLEFQDPSLTNVPYKFGFRPTRYSGERCYRSQDPISPQEIVPGRFNVLIADAQQNLDATTLSFYFSTPLPVYGARFQREGSRLRVRQPDQALGAQCGDVVELHFLPEEEQSVEAAASGLRSRRQGFVRGMGGPSASAALHAYHFEVVELVSGTEFVLEVGELDLPAQGSGSVQLVLRPTVSLFVTPNNTEVVKSCILGLGTRDLLWGQNDGDYLVTPYVYRMIPFTYVLLEMICPVGFTGVEHRYFSDHKTTLLGKILLSYEPELERFFPMRAAFLTGMRVDSFHFCILNPDHSPYQLHGQNWRATFRLFTDQNPNSLLTGVFARDEPRVQPPGLGE